MNLLPATGGEVAMAGTATWPCGLLSAELLSHFELCCLNLRSN